MSESIAPPDADLGGDPAPLPDNQTEPGSLRERLEAAYDEVEAREAGEGADTPPAPDKAASAKPDASRDPTGKFAPKNPPAEQPGAAKVAPPEWLTGKAGVDWNRLPRSIQESLAAAGPPVSAQQPAPPPPPTQAPHHPLDAVIQPHAEYFQQRGVQPEAGVAQLLQTYRALEADPAGTLAALAERYGVALAPRGAQQQPQQPDTFAPDGTPQGQLPDIERHPAMQALRQELAEMKQGFGTVQQRQQAMDREAVARRVGEASMTIEKFANDPANPRPHFEAVRDIMAHMIRAGQASDLADAYDRAVWANPSTRAALLGEQQAKAAEEAARNAAARAAAARKAALVAGRSAPVTGMMNGAKPSIRETMERIAEGME